ncbi:MAG: hypothetical protein ACFCU8_20690 [Thermosynechococcaceae cyanobacterium]
MTIRELYPSEIKCALRFDGHQYLKRHPEYQLSHALEVFGQSHNWYHLSKAEAMATLFLLLKAIETWRRSPRISAEHLDPYYDAFHSLYDLLKNESIPEP